MISALLETGSVHETRDTSSVSGVPAMVVLSTDSGSSREKEGGGGGGGGTEHTVSTARHNFTAHKSQSMDMMGPCNIKQTRHMQYNAWTHRT